MSDVTVFWALACLASLFVGAAKGGLPVVGMLSVPLMSVVMPPMLAAGMLLPIYILSDMYGIWLYRKSYSVINLKILIPAGIIGISVGWATVSITDEHLVKALIGLIGIGFVLDMQRRRFRKSTVRKPAKVLPGLFWGSLSGFTSFISHAGGPPYQVYMLPQRLEKMTFAGTTTILFAVINIAKLPPYIALGQMNTSSLSQAYILVPIALFGAWAGHKLTKILPERVFFIVVEIALFAVSVKLVWDGLFY